MANEDDTRLYAQLLNQMREKQTEELLGIWEQNDRDAWTDAAFQAVEQVLRERLGELPERQTAQIQEEVSTPAYPADIKLFRIAEWSKRIAWVILVFGILYSLFRLAINLFPLEGKAGIDVMSMAMVFVSSCLSYGFYFLVLQAIGEIIYLMMDIRELAHLDPYQEEMNI